VIDVRDPIQVAYDRIAARAAEVLATRLMLRSGVAAVATAGPLACFASTLFSASGASATCSAEKRRGQAPHVGVEATLLEDIDANGGLHAVEEQPHRYRRDQVDNEQDQRTARSVGPNSISYGHVLLGRAHLSYGGKRRLPALRQHVADAIGAPRRSAPAGSPPDRWRGA